MIYNPTLGVVDDGTYITVSHGATKLYRIVKATGQMQVAAGYDSDQTL